MKYEFKIILCVLLLHTLAMSSANAQTKDDWARKTALPKGEKRIALFNGKDLSGWEGRKEKYWSVENKVIKGANSEDVAASSYLFTKKRYREFRLLLEVKQTRGDNFSTMHSAVCALGERITDKGDEFSFKGPLLMFCNDWGIWDANRRNRIFPEQRDGTLLNPAEKIGDWNRIEILVVGNRIRMVSNGTLIIDFTDRPGMLLESQIGLQLHANNRPQEFHFRGLALVENPKDRLVTLIKEKAEEKKKGESK